MTPGPGKYNFSSYDESYEEMIDDAIHDEYAALPALPARPACPPAPLPPCCCLALALALALRLPALRLWALFACADQGPGTAAGSRTTSRAST
jgi:hypothetical protein